jgi:hypothetical protein
MKRISEILLMIAILTIAIIASASTLKTASAAGHPGIYYTVESATNGSTVVMGPDPAVGQNFTVAIKVYNVTTATAATGVWGLEVHLAWNTTLLTPLSFVSELGTAGGVLTGPGIIQGLNAGFYDNGSMQIPAPPYTNSTHFEVGAASTTGAWYGDAAVVAYITFQVDLQPQPFGTCPLALDFSQIADANAVYLDNEAVNATYTILTTTTTPETVTFNGTPYSLSIASDSQITAPANLGFQNLTNNGGPASLTFNVTSFDGFANVTVPQSFMYSIPATNWTITVDGMAPSSSSISNDSVNSYVWFNWTGAGDHIITLMSTNSVVPEFASIGLILLVLMTTLIVATAATVIKRKKLHS